MTQENSAKDHEGIYRKFLEVLKKRTEFPFGDLEGDFRRSLLERRYEKFNVGFVRRNLTTAFSANLPDLFPNLVAINESDFGTSRNFLLYGAVVDDPDLSHASTTKLLPHLEPEDSIVWFEMGFLASSASWSQSIAARSREMACLGYVYDDIAQYYMSDFENRLIRKLNSADTIPEAERGRAQAAMRRIVEKRISKYNSQPIFWPEMTPGYDRRVLVVDQNFSDASTLYGRATPETFERMLQCAIDENPDAEILIKTHPDLNWVTDGKRTGYFNHLTDSGRVRLIREGVNPFCLFDLVDKVYVGTSGMGLEALLAGKQVVCFGAPFYAGWGLTDDRQELPFRRRQRSLEELFHCFYMWYTVYHVPGRPVPGRIEDALDYIEANRPCSLPPTDAELAAPPKVSVILPVYNVEPYIEECLQSIQRQSLREIEIIPVNDCSPDGSQAIIDRLAKRDPRIRPIVLKKNVGQGFARNAGIDAARGEYLWFVDSDDWMPNRDLLKSVVAAAEANGSDMVRARKACEAVFSADGELLRERPDKTEAVFEDEVPSTTFAESPQILQNRHFWVWLYRRAFLDAAGIRFENTQWEERPFLIDALLAAERLSLLPVDAVTYRIREDSTARRDKTTSDYERQINNFELVAGKLLAAGAADRASPLRPHLEFTLSQYTHYLLVGPPYAFVRERPEHASLRLLDRVAKVFADCDFHASDFTGAPLALSRAHVEANAYPLMIGALRAGRSDMVDRAVNLATVAQAELLRTLVEEPADAMQGRFQQALSTYARNECVVPATTRAAPPAPLPRILVHIGASKTGSTTLQHLMEANRAELLRQGVWYPEVGLFWQKGRPHKQAGHSDFIQAAIRGDTSLRSYLEAGLALLGGRIHTIVLSSEAFFLHPRAHTIGRYFEGFPVEMLVYLRRQDEWANAQYSEFAAGGAVSKVDVPFDEWLQDSKTQHRLDYRRPILNWVQAVGHDNVTVRPFETCQFEGGDLIADFAAAARLPQLRDLPLPPAERRNEARLSGAHVELLRLYNSRVSSNRDSYFDFIEEATTRLNEWRAARQIDMPKPWVPKEGQAEEIMAQSEACNREIAESFLGRSDGRLFREPARVPAQTVLHPEEMRLVAEIAQRYPPSKRRSSDRSSSESVVNYGLFGWRLWALTPVLRRAYKHRTGRDLAPEFLREPALYARENWPKEDRRSRLYPDRDPAAPFRFWLPVMRPLVRRAGGEDVVQLLEEDPVLFVRTLRNPLLRIVGRLMFPCGELTRRY